MGAFKMWQIPLDRSRPAAQLPGTGISQSAESWSTDGHALAYTAITPEAGSHIMVESLEGDHESRPFADIKAAAGRTWGSQDRARKYKCQATVAPTQCGREAVASFISEMGTRCWRWLSRLLQHLQRGTHEPYGRDTTRTA